jgi:hypothetical protein
MLVVQHDQKARFPKLVVAENGIVDVPYEPFAFEDIVRRMIVRKRLADNRLAR